MPTGADNNVVIEHPGADARRLRTLQKLHIAAGLMTAMNWIAALAVVLGHLPSLDGLYVRLSLPVSMTFFWFVENSSMHRLRDRKWAMVSLVGMIIAGLFSVIGTMIELGWGSR
jgi:hypothetical protein